MAKRNKVTDTAAPAVGDAAEEARSLLRRLIDETQLRDAVARLIDEGQTYAEELPAQGRQVQKEARKRAKKQLKRAQKQAAKQQHKLARKSKAVAAGGKELAKQNKPGLKGRLALLLLAGVGALAGSETLRSKLLDMLFGAEEEFQYTPPEPPAEDNPSPLSAV